MNKEQYINEILSKDWSIYSGPEYYEPQKVPKAIIDLISLNLEDSYDQVYNNFLFAIGNNHAGTYYPAILGTLKYIIEIALNNDPDMAISRACALNILIDLYCSFGAEVGDYKNLSHKELEIIVTRDIESMLPKLVLLANNSTIDDRTKQLAINLQKCINEEKQASQD